MADFGTTFERLELKYLITEDQAERIRDAVQPFCRPDRYNGTAPSGGYVIENLYLDTTSLEFYRAWKRGDNDRIKLRIRTYGPSGPAFLEVKRKTSSFIHKVRVGVAREEVESAVLGVGSPLEAGDLRRHEILQQFAHFAARTGAAPTLCVRYEREAFASEVDRYARVTFDRRIRVQPTSRWLLNGDPSESWLAVDEAWLLDGLQSPLVLELKCERQMPLWMSRIITDFQLELRGFSKYGQGIEAMLQQQYGVDTRLLARASYV